jgi:hypothetical protein
LARAAGSQQGTITMQISKIENQHRHDAETGDEMLWVRLQHHTWAQIKSLLVVIMRTGGLGSAIQ